MKKVQGIVVICLLALLSGCGRQEAETGLQGRGPSGMEEEVSFSYEVPESSPGIIVNQLGYPADGDKLAVFTGRELPEQFHLIEEETGAVVFTGSPFRQVWNEETGEYIGYGDFTQVHKPGSYYIESAVLGRSYSFSIGGDPYRTILKEACRQYYYNRCGITLTEEYAGEAAHNACHTGKAMLQEDPSVTVDVSGGWHQDEKGQKDVVQAAGAVSVMLLSYELYGQAFTDDFGIPESGNGIPDLLDEIRYEVEWLLKMQNQETGAVYEGLTVYPEGGSSSGKGADVYVKPSSFAAEKAFAMALAKFSFQYQSFDSGFASQCLKAADRAWKHAEAGEEGETRQDSLKFGAAAELYRASGQPAYHRAVEEYLEAFTGGMTGGTEELVGFVTYISTTQPVQVPYCERIMEALMSRAELISQKAGEHSYLVWKEENREKNSHMLDQMMYMSVVNHIISNHEYHRVIENHLHYFLGRNPRSICYLDGVGDKSYRDTDESAGIMKQFDADCKLILMLSEIVG